MMQATRPRETAPSRTYGIATLAVSLAIVAAVVWPYVRDHRISTAKLDGCYHAAKAIDGAVGVGVAYAKFSELVQQLNTEVGIARDAHPSVAEAAIIDLYAQAVTVYRDSLTLWAEHIRSSRYLSDVGVVHDLNEKYALPTGRGWSIDSEEGVRVIWRKADESTTRANAAVRP